MENFHSALERHFHLLLSVLSSLARICYVLCNAVLVLSTANHKKQTSSIRFLLISHRYVISIWSVQTAARIRSLRWAVTMRVRCSRRSKFCVLSCATNTPVWRLISNIINQFSRIFSTHGREEMKLAVASILSFSFMPELSSSSCNLVLPCYVPDPSARRMLRTYFFGIFSTLLVGLLVSGEICWWPSH